MKTDDTITIVPLTEVPRGTRSRRHGAIYNALDAASEDQAICLPLGLFPIYAGGRVNPSVSLATWRRQNGGKYKLHYRITPDNIYLWKEKI